jgi:hypothetical protein
MYRMREYGQLQYLHGQQLRVLGESAGYYLPAMWIRIGDQPAARRQQVRSLGDSNQVQTERISTTVACPAPFAGSRRLLTINFSLAKEPP